MDELRYLAGRFRLPQYTVGLILRNREGYLVWWLDRTATLPDAADIYALGRRRGHGYRHALAVLLVSSEAIRDAVPIP